MFERLDPPEEFRPDEQFRSAVVTRGRRLRRRRHRVAGAALGTVVVMAAVVGVTAGWSKQRWEDVERVDVQGLPEEVDAVDGTPFNVLLVGVDGPRPEAEGVVGLRSDTIMVVRVEPSAGRVQVVSLPRDLWVAIPGHGEGRINRALGLGGPPLLVGTVESALDIPVDRYLEVDLDGFQALVDAAGGVRLELSLPLRSSQTGLSLPASGCHTLDGAQALALVRARSLERFIDGRWVMDPSGDVGRVLRQQEFGRAVLAALGAVGSNPVERARLLDAFAEHVAMDTYWTRDQLEDLVAFTAELESDDVSSRILPFTPATRGAAEVLLPAGEAYGDVIAALRGDAADARPGAAETPSAGPAISPC